MGCTHARFTPSLVRMRELIKIIAHFVDTPLLDDTVTEALMAGSLNFPGPMSSLGFWYPHGTFTVPLNAPCQRPRVLLESEGDLHISATPSGTP